MATPCSPFARALAIKSSGLDTPSPEKKVWVWRSIVDGPGGTTGAIETKAAWRMLTPDEVASGRYHTATAVYYTGTDNAPSGCGPALRCPSLVPDSFDR
mgnify:CR=1 FL=1